MFDNEQSRAIPSFWGRRGLAKAGESLGMFAVELSRAFPNLKALAMTVFAELEQDCFISVPTDAVKIWGGSSSDIHTRG